MEIDLTSFGIGFFMGIMMIYLIKKTVRYLRKRNQMAKHNG